MVAWSVFLYFTVWCFGTFVFAVIWNLISPWKVEWWAKWFFVRSLVLSLVLGTVTAIWFTIGGTLGLRDMFRRLKEREANIHDDGRVFDNVSAAGSIFNSINTAFPGLIVISQSFPGIT